ncbi:Kinase [Hexamita inflata]|uniref:CAMK CAMKL n=1 Tax=Hexamita inflata TaxID=28002 RepID=A0AA86P4R1_9EUKA|nr:CAMK CAMKL [Hexamita inflata]
MNEDIKDINRVVKQISHCLVESVELDSSIKNREQFAFLETQRLLSVCEYCPYQQISFKTFAGENNNDLSYLSKAQLGVALKLFMNIVITVNQLHRKHIYHFDIKPENILASETDFCIIDFGSAMHVEEKATHPLIEGQNIAQVYQGTELFSSSKLDSKDFWVVCDKYDSYSMGCLLYFISTRHYLSTPLEYEKDIFKSLVDAYGFLFADLIMGLTRASPLMRYSSEQIQSHPALKNIFNDTEKLMTKRIPSMNKLYQRTAENLRTSVSSSKLCGMEHPVINRKIVNANVLKKTQSGKFLQYKLTQNSYQSKTQLVDLVRSSSQKYYRLSKRHENVWDDQHNVKQQNALRHGYIFDNICLPFAKQIIQQPDIFKSCTHKIIETLLSVPYLRANQQSQINFYHSVLSNQQTPLFNECKNICKSSLLSAYVSLNSSTEDFVEYTKIYGGYTITKSNLDNINNIKEQELDQELDIIDSVFDNSQVLSYDDYSGQFSAYQ